MMDGMTDGQKFHLLYKVEIPYKAGNAVWYCNPKRKVGFNPKLQRPWKGHMLVVVQLNEALFRIQLSLKAKSIVIHHDKMKHYLVCEPERSNRTMARLNRSVVVLDHLNNR